VVIKHTTAEIRTIEVQNGDQTFTRLLMPSYSRTDVVGSPELPVRREFLEVPVGSSVRVVVTRSEYQDYNMSELGIIYPVMPAQAPASKGVEVHPFVYNVDAYNVNAFTRKNLLQLKYSDLWRVNRMGRLDLFPLQYNPATHTLRVFTELEVTVYFENGDIGASIDLKKKYENFYYRGLGRNMLNYQPLANRDTVATYPITYLIVSDPLFQPQLQPFVLWKTKQGFRSSKLIRMIRW